MFHQYEYLGYSPKTNEVIKLVGPVRENIRPLRTRVPVPPYWSTVRSSGIANLISSCAQEL